MDKNNKSSEAALLVVVVFVLGLLLIVEDRWMLLKTVTAFTVAHSITLAIATLGYAEVPVVPLNAAIALSILFLGPEIVRSWRGETSFTIRHPWVVAFAFGLLHGFGFASALTSAGLPHRELPLALVSFNVGVEIGQLGGVGVQHSQPHAAAAVHDGQAPVAEQGERPCAENPQRAGELFLGRIERLRRLAGQPDLVDVPPAGPVGRHVEAGAVPPGRGEHRFAQAALDQPALAHDI